MSKKILIFSLAALVALFGLTMAQAQTGPDFANGATFPGDGIWNIDGDVGIGTTEPTTALDVSGNIKFGDNIYNAYSWSPASDNLLPDPYFADMNQWTGEAGNSVETMQLPTGEYAQVLKITTTGDVQIYSNFIPVDNEKTYRLSLWIRTDNATTGTRYLGFDCYNSAKAEVNCYNSAGVGTANYYFWNGDLTANTWFRKTGYLFGSGTANDWTNPSDTASSNYRLGADVAYIKLRFLNYYNAGVSVSNWFGVPTVEEVQSIDRAWAVRDNGNIVSLVSGNTGIGITAPGSKLDVLETTLLGETAGNSQIITTFQGKSSNFVKNMIWLVRDAAGTSWTTARVHDAISVDSSFTTPMTDTKTWWERDPNNNIQSWGTAASSYMTINAGNVGIGTTAPLAQLDVSDLIKMRTSTITQDEDVVNKGYLVATLAGGSGSTVGYWGLSGSNLYASSTAWNVGIGTTNPKSKLELYGAGQLTANLTDAGVRTDMLALNSSTTSAGSGGALIFGNVQSVAAGSLGWASIKGHLTNGGTNTIGDLVFSTRNAVADVALTERMRILANGKVGIGTTAPSANLTVIGKIALNPTVALSSALHVQPSSASSDLARFYNSDYATGVGSGFRILTGATSGDTYTGLQAYDLGGTSDNNLILQQVGGNVGIGMTNPRRALEVKAALATPDLTVPAAQGALVVGDGSNVGMVMGTLGSPYPSYIQSRNFGTASIAYDLLLNPLGGNVGVGTIAPASKLHVSTGTNTDSGTISLTLGSVAPSSVRQFVITKDTTTPYGSIITFSNNTVAEMGYLAFRAAQDSEVMRLTSTGLVGIGTTAPAAGLEVATAVSGYTIKAGAGKIGNVATPTADDDAATKAYADSVASASQPWGLSGSNLYASSTAWKVGIGITSPQAHLDINTESAETTKVRINGEVTQQKRLEIRHYDASEAGLENNMAFIASKAGDSATLGHVNTSAADVDVLTWTQAGNVGIGTTAPEVQLHILGTGNTIARITSGTSSVARLDFGDSDDTDRGWIVYNNSGDLMQFVVNAATRMTINSSGYFGIGTTAPTAGLEVATVASGYTIKAGSGKIGNVATPTVDTDAATKAYVDSMAGTYWGLSGSNLYASSTAWNVGIGTTAPAKLLQITKDGGSSASAPYLRIENTHTTIDVANDYGGIEFYANDVSTGGVGVSGFIKSVAINAGVTSALTFGSRNTGNATEMMRINNLGYVGIGTTAPDQALTVAGDLVGYGLHLDSSTGAGIEIDRGATTNAGGVYFQTAGTDDWWMGLRTDTDKRFHIKSGNFDGTARITILPTSGNVGIGTTAPSEKLEVNGNVKASSFIWSSDRNLKKNVASIDNSLEKILKLRGVTFDWKQDGSPSVGLIAQEVEKVFPELVFGQDGAKGVQYANLVAPLIEAVKAQQAKIEDLEAKTKTIDDLEARIRALEIIK
ncbi:TPA: hypothetical protein DCZ15_02325 [Candidatus Falkowbacteria bacterium]|nr:MAG: Cell wall surface anchor family protein [Candidatus Falkowbacteria bacterium GW2011_GWF2_43_32]HBA36690.1 hypothetical protein [Candidatus Falkowbacteria bacterium]